MNYTYTEIRPKGDANGDWKDIAFDGNYLITAEYEGRVYTSANLGTNWTERIIWTDNDFEWLRCAISGQYMSVVNNGTIIGVSSDYGANWLCNQPNNEVITWMNEPDPPGYAFPSSVSFSYGMEMKGNDIIVYGMSDYQLVDIASAYMTIDGGINWTPLNPINGYRKDMQTNSASIDGNNILLSQQVYDLGVTTRKLYLSTNYGGSWNEIDIPEEISHYAKARISGNYILLIERIAGRVWISSDLGDNWSEVQPGGDYDYAWYDCDIADNGETMVVVASDGYSTGGPIYTSVNYGETWAKEEPEGNYPRIWSSCRISGDYIVATIYGGRIWLMDKIDIEVTTNEATAITVNGATLNGEIATSVNATERGFQWYKDGVPETVETTYESGDFEEGAYTATLSTVLDAGTKYYYRAYAKIGGANYYGEYVDFTTLTTYHFRAYAVDENGETVYGQDNEFTFT